MNGNILENSEYSDASMALKFAKEHIEGVVVLQESVGDACAKVGLESEALDAYKESVEYFGEISTYKRDAIIAKIKKYEPEYTYVEPVGGCYVATAVYGSYDCPQVWTLRRYRDYTLAETWYGRAFIRTYYAISPTLVKWFGETDWFKKLWKGKLDKMVEKLQSEGVASTPYEDREW